jgi:hypothetical protein
MMSTSPEIDLLSAMSDNLLSHARHLAERAAGPNPSRPRIAGSGG